MKASSEKRRLSDILDLNMVKQLPSAEIADLWKQYYDTKPLHISLALGDDSYKEWFQRAKRKPFALIPLFDDKKSVTNYIVEHRFNSTNQMDMEIGFCQLEDYKLYGPSTPSSLKINAYGDLLEEKRIALLSGSFDERLLGTRLMARTMMVCTCETYNRLFEWIERFTDEPSKFDYQIYLMAFKAMIESLAKNSKN